MKASGKKAQFAGMNAFNKIRGDESRRRLIDAAKEVFSTSGYTATSVDDIAQKAGISRQTFYNHFDGKLAIAMEYFERENSNSLPYWLQIAKQDFTNPDILVAWIRALFDYHEANRNILQTFVEMGITEPSFVERVKELIPEIITQLGRDIPAFAAAHREKPEARRRWVKAWLLLYHLREQCHMNATGFMWEDRQLIIEEFADSFHQFIKADDK